MNEQAWKEQAARIIDPSSWAVMDGYLKQMLRQYKGKRIGYDPEAFKHKESMAIAEALWPLVQQAIAAEREVLAGTRCHRCGMYAPDKLSGDCNRPECEYRKPVPPTEAQIRADERERCAKVAEERMPAIQCMSVEPVMSACEDIAAAIRSLKESDNGAG